MKSLNPSQLKFVFADKSVSPQTGIIETDSGQDAKADASAGKSYLLLTAEDNLTTESDTPANDSGESHDRLLERVASLPNLARALLFVASNKGAAGVDGVSTDESAVYFDDFFRRRGRSRPQATAGGSRLPEETSAISIPSSAEAGHIGRAG